ncbi:hypothetical protein AB4Y45_34920 [Paraburkholderia sp. EG287A]|uniref:hypothetical protein n=1 Tax=Paraburkholderia sp. EG287A TaxID=3237012 RepID=UPI0034D284C4
MSPISGSEANMNIVCRQIFKGQPELDMGRTIWGFIGAADRISCVMDGDAIQVAAIKGVDEVPLAEVGVGLWQKPRDLGDVLASFAAWDGHAYRARLQLFASKPVTWLG